MTIALRQILTGLPLPQADPCCMTCGAHLEGARIAAVAHNIDTAGWHINSITCIEHGPRDVPETSCGESVLAHARLGMLADVVEHRHDPALLDVEIVDAALREDSTLI